MPDMPSGSQPLPTAGDRSPTLWRHADFMKLWVGQTISQFGSALSRLALPLIAALTLNALFGIRALGLNAATLGLVYGIGASGAFLGSLEVLPVVFAMPRTAVPLLVLSSLLGNFGWVLYNVNETSVRQAVTPMALQGRMNATFRFLVSGMLPLGAMVGGAAGEVFGLRETITLAAIGSLLSCLWVVCSPVRDLARLPEAA